MLGATLAEFDLGDAGRKRVRPVTTSRAWSCREKSDSEGGRLAVLSPRHRPEAILAALAAFGMAGKVRHSPGPADGPLWAIGCPLPADEADIEKMLALLEDVAPTGVR